MAISVGGGVLASDPADKDVGYDLGCVLRSNTLRAPDLAIGEFAEEPGWAEGAPPLAVEYADTGQDEADLRIKIAELLAAGSRYIWVVRLVGPRRVEIHEQGKKMRVAHPGEELAAPGVLANAVPVEALYDRDAARQVIFRNLLQGQGYGSLDEVRAEGEALGRAEGELQTLRAAVVEVVTERGMIVEDRLREVLAGCEDPDLLAAALRRAAVAGTRDEVLAVFR